MLTHLSSLALSLHIDVFDHAVLLEHVADLLFRDGGVDVADEERPSRIGIVFRIDVRQEVGETPFLVLRWRLDVLLRAKGINQVN